MISEFHNPTIFLYAMMWSILIPESAQYQQCSSPSYSTISQHSLQCLVVVIPTIMCCQPNMTPLSIVPPNLSTVSRFTTSSYTSHFTTSLPALCISKSISSPLPRRFRSLSVTVWKRNFPPACSQHWSLYAKALCVPFWVYTFWICHCC
jgi:hypothetical protein